MSCGKPFPSFNLPAVIGGQIKTLSNADIKGKYAVFLFYPMDFTFVCPTEILAFHDAYAEFKSRNCELIVASGDSAYTHLAWQGIARNKGGIGSLVCPHLSDFGHSLTKDLGIYNECDTSADANGSCYRGLFLVDPNGKIAHVTINDYAIGRNVEECLRVIDAIEYVKTTGNVCQAGWKKGDSGFAATADGVAKFIVNLPHK